MTEIGKKVFRTTRGAPIEGVRRTESTVDAEAKPEPEEVTDDADLTPRAKRRMERIREFFASPLKAKELQSRKPHQGSTLRERAFDTTPSDYRSMLAKHRNRGGE